MRLVSAPSRTLWLHCPRALAGRMVLGDNPPWKAFGAANVSPCRKQEMGEGNSPHPLFVVGNMFKRKLAARWPDGRLKHPNQLGKQDQLRQIARDERKNIKVLAQPHRRGVCSENYIRT